MNTKKRKKGQIAIMLAMSFTLLLLLVAMVVNISFLVTAKINLQNAVDLAAYAGAAQQARYLTEIGKWNYEMRRNYKAMVFDYVIAYNAEYNKDYIKDYINNVSTATPPTPAIPIVCASLQRQAPGSSSGPNPTNEEKICQAIPYQDFQNAINIANNAAVSSGVAYYTACTADPTACSTWMTNYYNMLLNAQQTYNASTGYSNKYNNYADADYNYNARLMGWTLHAYRHMQTRIRGIHYGSIGLTNRLQFTADNHITVFNNSPISVAAKVINGFTDVGPTKTLKVQNNLIELDSQSTVTNPMHNAAYTTFKNNLLKVFNPTKIRLFHIVPSTPTAGAFDSKDMASGCNGASPTCEEYAGPYLRLQQHDVNFDLYFMKIINPLPGGGKLSVGHRVVPNFPVGVLKDNRVLTYYAVVGIADTSQIPFKVFFGDSDTAQAPSLVAVAAARPFGSRIGPYIDDKCEKMYENNTACEENGRDPLYPKVGNTLMPNFSVVDDGKDPRKLGVKLTVDKNEYDLPTTGTMYPQIPKNPNKKVDLFAKTYGMASRVRYYTRPGGYDKDDGFNTNQSDPDFYENQKIQPQGNRNSIFAWNTALTPTVPSGSSDELDDFEAYLKAAGNNKSPAIHKFDTDPARKYNNSEYSVYVFRYPMPGTSAGSGNDADWSISALTKKQYPNAMEKAFANTMAVNEFEIKRYIIPYMSPNVNPAAPTQDWLNYITNTTNKKAYIYAGETNRDPIEQGFGSKPFADTTGGSSYAKMEGTDVLFTDTFPEAYTAWRIGTRGYRVKLVNIQDLLGTNLKNPLPSTITIPDLNITIDLSKINY
ncbi:MAG: pilus assembly protein TadG-related protein [Proteobacteria bacterium]|nr:pilus assembly protein TadG-related protein [Pseudomonadota bacterium]